MESNNRLHELRYSYRRLFIAILRRTRDSKRHPFIKYIMDIRSQSYGSRPDIHGLSHGLKIARQLSIFAPVCTSAALSSPFRAQNKKRRHKPPLFVLAHRKGLEKSRFGSVQPSPVALIRATFNCSSPLEGIKIIRTRKCGSDYSSLAHRKGLEPPTLGTGIRCSIH